LEPRYAFVALLSIRSLAALYTPISDCDEVFNYWEPFHLLLHGYGFQTWEYSPAFALRSYLYLFLHVILYVVCFPIWSLAQLVGFSLPVGKVATFYIVRFGLVGLSSFSDAMLFDAVSASLGARRGWVTILMLAGSGGIAACSASFLPSSFAMSLISISIASLLYALSSRDSTTDQLAGLRGCVWSMGVAGLVGWPFVGLLALPMAVGLLRVLPLRSVVVVGLQAAGALGLMVLLADTVMYGKVTFSPLNLIAYNVMGLGGDSTLYGTEPWWFYIANGIINLNIALPLAAALPVVIGLRSIFYPARKGDSSMSSRKNDSLTEIWWIAVAIFCPAFVWVLCMSLQVINMSF